MTGLGNTTTGYLRVFPFNGTSAQGSPVPLNTVNTTITNDIIVPASQGATQELKVFSTTNTHYAAFVTGYFMAPSITQPECTYVTQSITMPANATSSGFATCPDSYAATGGGCRINASLRFIASEAGFSDPATWFCAMENTTATETTGSANARCCRVPGC